MKIQLQFSLIFEQKILVVLSFRDLKQIELNGYKFPYWTHVIGEYDYL
jgi:hypothetical protein